MAHFPKSVTRQQLVDACAAFAKVIGFDPKMACYPLHVGHDTITLPGIVVDDEGKRAVVHGVEYDDAALLTTPVAIKVLG